jgi:hypothetical protein
MSVSTPILTTSSDICARAAGGRSIAKANAPSTNVVLVDITAFLPLAFGALAVLP